MKIVVDKQYCRGSGECIKVCPHNAISMENGKAVIDLKLCDLDGICIPACPHGAIRFQE